MSGKTFLSNWITQMQAMFLVHILCQSSFIVSFSKAAWCWSAWTLLLDEDSTNLLISKLYCYSPSDFLCIPFTVAAWQYFLVYSSLFLKTVLQRRNWKKKKKVKGSIFDTVILNFHIMVIKEELVKLNLLERIAPSHISQQKFACLDKYGRKKYVDLSQKDLEFRANAGVKILLKGTKVSGNISWGQGARPQADAENLPRDQTWHCKV